MVRRRRVYYPLAEPYRRLRHTDAEELADYLGELEAQGGADPHRHIHAHRDSVTVAAHDARVLGSRRAAALDRNAEAALRSHTRLND